MQSTPLTRPLAALCLLFTAQCTAAPIPLLGDVLLPPGFDMELVHRVDAKTQGSWVCLTAIGDGRLVASTQYGSLYVVTPSEEAASSTVQKLPLATGMAQGMSVVNGALYYLVNDHKNEQSGLHVARDSNGDGLWDTSRMLRRFDGHGEHGPHAVIPAPDGRSLYVACGNMTKPTKFDWTRPPRVWQDDVLLPRVDDPLRMFSHLREPGGWIARTDLEGKQWELIAMGFRNEYDIALNHQGELFTFDSDNEYDIDTPWYRPTRVCHVTSGAEFGWRHGTGKWPTRYEDSVAPAVNVGPGSPTGVTFGYRAKFPAKYRNALLAADWSHGRVFAITLSPDGAGYTGTVEPFLSASPLPVTDLAVNPTDGALYLTTGGRRIASALWRIKYTGDDPVALPYKTTETKTAGLRRKLESLHANDATRDTTALDFAWKHLSHNDRRIRYAARIAVEHQPVEQWLRRALDEATPQARPYALLAAARCAHPESRSELLAAIEQTKFAELTPQGKLTLLRAAGVCFSRYGTPREGKQLIAALAPHFPTGNAAIDQDLAPVLLALNAPQANAKTVKLMEDASLDVERLHYAHALAQAKTGWTRALRRSFYQTLNSLAARGRHRSMGPYVERIVAMADAALNDASRADVADLIAARKASKQQDESAPVRPFVRKWTETEVAGIAGEDLSSANLKLGRRMFAQAQCFHCHRFRGEGGSVGPDLTTVARRFSAADMAKALVDPNATISDQYRQTAFSIDGKSIVGRIVNLSGDDVMIATDFTDPKNYQTFKASDIEEQFPSKNSPMPAGLLDVLSEEELQNLLAYLKSK